VPFILAAALIAAGYYAYQWWSTPVAPTVTGAQVPVRRATIAQTVTTSGTTVSTRQAKLNFASGGRIKDVLVKLGDQVTVGQPIAILEPAPLEFRVDSARSALRQAEIRVQQLRESATPEDVAAAQRSFDAAQAKYQELAAGPAAGDVEAAQSQVASAVANLNSAIARLDIVVGGPKADELSAARSQVEAARTSYESAQAKLDQLKAGPKADEVATARSQLENAKESVRSSQAKLDLLVKGGTAADSASAERDVRNAQSTYDSAVAKLADLQQGPEKADVRQAKADLDAAVAALKVAEAKYKNDRDQRNNSNSSSSSSSSSSDDTSSNRFAGGSDVSNATLRADKALVDSAKAKVEASQSAYARTLQGPKPGEIATAQTAVDTAKGNLDAAKARLIQLKVPNPFEVEQAKAAVDQAKSTQRAAEVRLEVLLAGAVQADLITAQGTVDSARAQHEAARDKLNQLMAGPTSADVRSARAGVESAQAGLDSARIKLDQVRAGAKPAEIEAAQASVAAAQAQLASKTGSIRASELALAMENVKTAESGLRQAEYDLQNATLTAPIPGVVAAINANPGEQAGSGATNQNTTNVQQSALVTIIDPREVRVDANVDEVDVAKLTVGKPAEVSFEAVQNRRFRGQVVAVSPSGVSAQGVVTYPVSINLQVPPELTLPSGLTASVIVQIEQRQDVLVVPSRAIRRQGREQTVEVVVGSGTEVRNVRPGLSNDQLTEITEGLRENDVVVVPGTTTAPVRTGGGGPGGGFGGVPNVKPGGR
jgi:HlyD family secretion protein